MKPFQPRLLIIWRSFRHGALFGVFEGPWRISMLRCIMLAILAFLSVARTAGAQQWNFDAPLSVVKIKLPLKHPPVDFVCVDQTGRATEARYWQKNPQDDGFSEPKLQPGQMVPPCNKVVFPDPPLLVTCSTYTDFVVKERQSEGQEGDDNIALLPKTAGSSDAPCDDKVAPGEFTLKPKLLSEGFVGVVGRYVLVAEIDDDNFGWNRVNVFRDDAPGPIAFPSFLWNDRTFHLVRVADGFDLRFMTEKSLDCGVDGDHGAACLAGLERATGANITRSECLKAVPELHLGKSYPNGYPVALEYPALLSVRGLKTVLRATGPAVACIPQE